MDSATAATTKDTNAGLFSELAEQFLGSGVVDEEAFKRRLSARLLERRTETMVKHAMGSLDPTPHNKHIEGIGQAMFDVDPDEMMFWDMKFPGCWFDAEFRREYCRDNPAAKSLYDSMRCTILV